MPLDSSSVAGVSVDRAELLSVVLVTPAESWFWLVLVVLPGLPGPADWDAALVSVTELKEGATTCTSMDPLLLAVAEVFDGFEKLIISLLSMLH